MPIFKDMSWKKHLLFAGGALLAISSSISVCTVTDVVSDLRKHWLKPKAAVQAQTNVAPELAFNGTDGGNTQLATGTPNSPLNRMPQPTLEDVLQLDISVDWVLQRWPRVTTGLTHLQLQGYRVPLVSGTSTADVAGSLTYYFNAQQQVQRITLRGTTGDPRQLASILGSRFGFTRRLTNDPGLILFEAVDASNRATGTLKIRSAPVVNANQPRSRFVVDLVLER
jgi:hypothetical protein